MRLEMLVIAMLLLTPGLSLIDGTEYDQLDVSLENSGNFMSVSRDPSIKTLIDGIDIPESAIYKRTFTVTGELLRDNNGDGIRDAGDTVIPDATVNLLWNDNTAIIVDRDLVTDDIDETNPGRFSTDLSANHVPGQQAIDLELSFWGQFSNSTGDLYGMTEDLYNKLIMAVYGEDDDGDGSTDEEMLNGIDDDGDFRVDEDVDAYLVTDPIKMIRTIEILHLTQLSMALESNNIELGHSREGWIEISGQLKDSSITGTDMGEKTLAVYFDGELVEYIIAKSSSGNPGARYFYSFAPGNDTPPGDFEVKVMFDTSFNETNRFFNASEVSKMVRVYRPLEVIFHEEPEGYDQVYVPYGEDVYINMSIVDRLLYNDGITQGPLLDLGGNDYDGLYTFNIQWGEPGSSFHITYKGMVMRNESGYFSLKMDYIPTRMPIGRIPVMIVSTFNLGLSDPTIYYNNLEGDENSSTYFNIMGDTEIRLWTDQNQNNINDFSETDKSGNIREIYITRTPYTTKTGVVQNWNVSRIRGQLVDLTLTDEDDVVGVPGKTINFFWNFGRPSEYSPEEPIVTDADGLFAVDVPITLYHSTGPVVVYANYSADLTKGSYGSSSYLQINGTNFSVMAVTDLSHNIEGGEYLKGEEIPISGSLLDDKGNGLSGREVEIYLLHVEDHEPGTVIYHDIGDRLVTTVITDSSGGYQYGLNIDSSIVVGKYWLYAIFRGSEEYPGDGSLRYEFDDAFVSSIVQPVPIYIQSDVVIRIDETKLNFTREAGGTIEGWVLEDQDNSMIPISTAGNSLQAYVEQGENSIYLGETTQFGVNSSFKFVIGRMSDKFQKGEISLRIVFIPGNIVDDIPLYSEMTGTFTGFIWDRSWIKEIEFGPQDTDELQDGKPDFLEWNISNLLFSFQLMNGEGAQKSGPPIAGQELWFNITMLSFKSSNLLVTDEDGKVSIEFTTNLTDTETGEPFSIPEGWKKADLNVTVSFGGGAYARPSELIYRCTFRVLVEDVPVDEEPEDSGKKGISPVIIIIIFIVILLIIAGIVGAFLLMRSKEEPEEERIKFEDVIHETLEKLEGLQPYHETMMKSISDMTESLGLVSALDDYGNVTQEFKDTLLEEVKGNEEVQNEIVLMIEDSERDQSLLEDLSRKRAILWLKQIEEEVFEKVPEND